MMRWCADELFNPPVDTTTENPSVPTLDTTDKMARLAQRPHNHTSPNLRRHVTNTTESTSHTQSRNSCTDNALTTWVTDGDVRIDTMLRDSLLSVINHVEQIWMPGVIYKYFLILHTKHSYVKWPSRHVLDFCPGSNWYRDRYRSNVMYESGHVCLTTRQRITWCTCRLCKG